VKRLNKVALARAAVCTLAVSSLSTATGFFVAALNGAPMEPWKAAAALVLAGLGFGLFYVGHCREMMQR
jgi:hypothetical protein